MKKFGLAIAAVAGLLLTPSVASAQLCAVGIIAKAFYINATEHRELTAKEAASCGILTDEPAKPALKKKKRKVAHAADKK
jgi:hypothetical protein